MFQEVRTSFGSQWRGSIMGSVSQTLLLLRASMTDIRLGHASDTTMHCSTRTLRAFDVQTGENERLYASARVDGDVGRQQRREVAQPSYFVFGGCGDS